jgi:hypothetical protein
MENPTHGGGFDFYSIEIYEKYYPEFLVRFPGKVWSCHSTWLTLFGEHGLPGIIIFVALIGSCLFTTRDIRRYEKSRDGTAGSTVYAPIIQSFIIVYLISGTFMDAAYFDGFYYIVATVIVCKELFLQKQRISLRTEVEIGSIGHNAMKRAKDDSRDSFAQ